MPVHERTKTRTVVRHHGQLREIHCRPLIRFQSSSFMNDLYGVIHPIQEIPCKEVDQSQKEFALIIRTVGPYFRDNRFGRFPEFR